MLDHDELKEIAQMRDDSVPCFVSLYLNVDPVANPKGEHLIQFKNMLKAAAESLDKKVYKLVKEDLKEIESFVLGNKRQFKKGLAFLVSTHESFRKIYHLGVPVKSELIIEKFPYIKPLLDVLDRNAPYLVLVVGREAARIFTIHLGEIVEYGEVQTPDVPGKHKKGGWFALAQNHYERHVDYHVTLHLDEVLKKLDSFMAGEQIRDVVIGGPGETVAMTKGILPAHISEKIVGTFSAEMFAAPDEVLAKAEAIINAYDRKRKDETAERLINQALKNENAVLGLENVLHALQEGRVMRLIYDRDLHHSGYACRSCRSLAAQDIKECPYCKGGMEGVNYVVDLAVQKAVTQGATVEVVTDHKKFTESGGIGAFLRF